MARTDINRYRGDTKNLILKLTQNKQVFDLTGFSAKLSVSAEEEPIGSVYAFQLTATIDSVNGTLTFQIAEENVDLIGDFYYDIELTDGAGKTSTIRKGKMVFAQDITK